MILRTAADKKRPGRWAAKIVASSLLTVFSLGLFSYACWLNLDTFARVLRGGPLFEVQAPPASVNHDRIFEPWQFQTEGDTANAAAPLL